MGDSAAEILMGVDKQGGFAIIHCENCDQQCRDKSLNTLSNSHLGRKFTTYRPKMQNALENIFKKFAVENFIRNFTAN